MAIFGINNEEEIINVSPSIEEINSTPVFESEDLPIITQIGGYEWIVNYYNLIADLTDNLSTVDTSLDLAITEYNKINNLVLYMDSPLDNNIPEDLSGEALININITPKNGDFFIAKLLDGRLGIFYLTGVTKERYNLNDVFKITFKLYHIATTLDDEVLVKLNAKIVDEYYYNKDYGIQRTTPLYSKEEYSNIKELSELHKVLINYFNTTFLNPDNYKILSLKDEYDIILDPYMESFIRKTFGVTNLPKDLYYYGYKPKGLSILDLVYDNLIMVNQISKYISPVYSNKYGTNIYLKQSVWSSVNKIIELSKDVPEPETTVTLYDNSTGNDYFPAINNTTYIFNSDLYDILNNTKTTDEVTLTKLEVLVLKLINRDSVDINDIVSMYENINTLNLVQQFYYIPILVLGMKYYNSKIPITKV